MIKEIVAKNTKGYSKILNIWVQGHVLGLFIFNIILIILVLLNTAQYFKPFYYLGINEIFFISMIMSIFLLGARSRTMFLISILFLILSMVLKVVKVDIWADRASVYFYQSFTIGLVLLLSNNN